MLGQPVPMVLFHPQQEKFVSFVYPESLALIAAERVCRQLQERTRLKCSVHPKTKSIIIVSVHPEFTLQLQRVCCNTFKQQLEIIVARK